MPGLATTFVNPVSITLDSQRSSLLGVGGDCSEVPVVNQNSAHMAAFACLSLVFVEGHQ